MKKFSFFQIGAIVVCILLGLVGVAVFATYKASSGKSVGAVTVWGTEDQLSMQNILEGLVQKDKSLVNVEYVEQNPNTFESDLVNAMASGDAPDLVLLPEKDILSFEDKLITIPYSAISQSAYENTFINEGQLFLTQNGELALPFLVDPLVMYWNRDLLANAGIASPPASWDEILAQAPSLVKEDASGNITESAVAMGAWSNIANARALFSALVMQAGDPIVSEGSGGAEAVLGANPMNAEENPAASALRFYTDFANPTESVYSWNHSLPEAQSAFAAGDLAYYFGFASENALIGERNPNLNYSVALLPQPKGAGVSITYGNLIGLAIPKGAKNPQGALDVAEILSSQAGQQYAEQALGLPSVRRDMLGAVSNDAAQTVFNQSALIARGFLDPNPSQTDQVFSTMVQSVVSGASTPSGAVESASQSFKRLFESQ